MIIGLITDSIRNRSTGIGYFAKNVIEEILLTNKKVYLIDFLKTDFNKRNLLRIKNPSPFLKTYLWHNYLPFATKNLNMDYIFNFTAVPHLFSFKQKEIFFVYDVSWYLYPEYHRKMRVFYYKLLFKICLNNCFRIVTDSVSAKNDLMKYFNIPKDKISVIYPTFTDKLKEPKEIQYNINYPYILFIGTLEPRKNIISIIKAFKKLKGKKKIEEKLIICGKKGWLYEEIFGLIKKLNISDDVVYLGYITDEEKKWLFKHAQLFIYPSWYEGFGIPVLEAMTYGCPVITSNTSSLPEAAGQAGISIDPKNVIELENAIYKVITSKTLRQKMIKEGFKQVKKLSNLDQVNELINSL